MPKRPPEMSPEEWRAQRDRFWWRVNMGFNALMVVTVVAFVLRNCVPTS